MTMKKILYTTIILLSFYSCRNESFDLTNTIPQEITSKPISKMPSDGRYDALGFGYDVMGEYLASNSVKPRILDMERFISEHPDLYYDPAYTNGYDEFHYGATAKDYLKDITQSCEIKRGFNTSLFTGTFKANAYFNNKTSYNSKYSFASVNSIFNLKRLYVLASPAVLSDYLTDDFKNKLNTLSADEIIKTYGTHVLTDFTIGGRYSMIFRSTIDKYSDETTKKIAVEAGLKFASGSIGANVDYNISNDQTIKYSEENTDRTVFITYNGGTTSGASYNLETGYPTINLSSWQSTINSTHCALASVNWPNTYPIYEFVTDLTKKNQLIAAFNSYISNNQLVDQVDVSPIHEYYSKDHKDHLYTNYWGGLSLVPWTEYKYNNLVVGYIPKDKLTGTLPLYEFYSANSTDHFYTTTNISYVESYWKYKYNNIILGYIYTTQIEGTVPLYEYYSSRCSDHYYSTSPRSIIETRWPDYKYNNVIVGYIYSK
jgi:hypothetical protein